MAKKKKEKNGVAAQELPLDCTNDDIQSWCQSNHKSTQVKAIMEDIHMLYRLDRIQDCSHITQMSFNAIQNQRRSHWDASMTLPTSFVLPFHR